MAPLGLTLRAAAPSARAPVTQTAQAPSTPAPLALDGAVMDQADGTPLDLITAALDPLAHAVLPLQTALTSGQGGRDRERERRGEESDREREGKVR